MNKKKILVLAVSVCLVAILAIGGTLAYFTDDDEVKNTFTMGGVEIDLFETDEDGEREQVGLSYAGVVPGIAYDKDPTVENKGSLDAWVRVNVTLTKYSIFEAAARKHGVTKLDTIFDDFDDSKWTLAKAPVVDSTANTVTYSYYYNEALIAGSTTGSTTVPLFTSVTIPAAFTGDDLNGLTGFEIIVTADAIQKDPFTNAADAFKAFDAA